MNKNERNNIRNFVILAHVDHGKSTLADRLLEITGTIPPGKMREQVLDRLDLERERGITIKAQAVRMNYVLDGQRFQVNLIDTPGHVDFSYEVSRSLAACEGALLVVDAAQGVEAQTISNAYLAVESGLEIIPVLNKIDLPAARSDEVVQELRELLGNDIPEPIRVSAKTGEGVQDILDKLLVAVPPPSGDPESPLRALIFDSLYDPYRGVIAFVRVVDGKLQKGGKVRFSAAGMVLEIEEVGVMTPEMRPLSSLQAGEVGYVITGVKDIHQVHVGDTIMEWKHETEPLPGYREVKPMVFAGLYPLEGGDYAELKVSLEKLQLNDPAFVYQPETSQALGFGFRCGFLGLLHMEIIKERLEREYGQELLITTPTVTYKVTTHTGEIIEVSNPADLPPSGDIVLVEEPYVDATLIMPSEYVGAMMELCNDRRGQFQAMNYLTPSRVQLNYLLPLADILLDFFGEVKARSRGYASLDYDSHGWLKGELAKLNILIAGDIVDALSVIVPKDNAYQRGKELIDRLKEVIPRQHFDVPLQAAIGSRIISRETIKAKRKDVTAKCYGGDITRKRKLLEKQKEGKKKMKMLGKVEVPPEAFIAVLQTKVK